MATKRAKLSLFDSDGLLLKIPAKDRKKIYLEAAELSYELFEEYSLNSGGEQRNVGMCITTAIVLTRHYHVDDNYKFFYGNNIIGYWDNIKSIDKSFLFWAQSEKFLPEMKFFISDSLFESEISCISGVEALNFRVGLLSLCAALCDDEDFQNYLK